MTYGESDGLRMAADNEQPLGQWFLAYVCPAGGRYAGQLRVTQHRVVFAASVTQAAWARRVSGTVDCESIAWAFDLDRPNIAYDGARLTVSIPASQIETVTAIARPFNRSVNLTIRNNGSVQQFDRGLLPVGGLVRAIRQAVQNQVRTIPEETA